MSLAIVRSRAAFGIHAPLVTVEVHLSNGLPRFMMVGLPEAAVKESQDRVRSAIMNSGFSFHPQRITVNLGPADLPKGGGGRYDLPIAIGILAASKQIPTESLNEYEFVGELALGGALRPTAGILPFALQTQRSKHKLILPAENSEEALLAGEFEIYPAHSLREIHAHFTGLKPLECYKNNHLEKIDNFLETAFDLCDVQGQKHAKRALEIAASGNHSLLMIGPPGTGKTMLALRLSSILPELSYEEALETAAILSISPQGFKPQYWKQRPFRSPHHTASPVSLVGGGKPPKPGEISLAHNGILFLDELPEFQQRVLESLREPLESGSIVISRAAWQAEFPARFQLIAAMNPCPCGYLTDKSGRCQCGTHQIQRYRRKISGPLLDRIDMHIEVPALEKGALTYSNSEPCEKSDSVKQRVINAREIQQKRQGMLNASLKGKTLEKNIQLNQNDKDFLDTAIQKLNLSARAYHRILRVARTIADLSHSQHVERHHIAEAISYRRLERGEGN